MKKKKIIIAAAGLTTLFALAVAGIEWKGYAMFDGKDGRNILCTVDPKCRQLNQNEIDQARVIFGDAIDYRHVKLFRRPYMWLLNPENTAITPNGNIYLTTKSLWSDDYTFTAEGRKLLHHELTHVWQYQTGKVIPGEALSNLLHNDFDYDSSYKYRMNEYRLFADYNIEQQASMIGDYTALRQQFEEVMDRYIFADPPADTQEAKTYIARECPALRLFEDKIGQVFPLTREGLCPVPEVAKPRPRLKHPRRHP